MNPDAEDGFPGGGSGDDGTGKPYDESLFALAVRVDDPQHANDRADFVEFVDAGVLGIRISLGDHKEKAVLPSLVQCGKRSSPTDRQGHRHAGIDNNVPYREQG
jgi:hypothetical protein